MYIQYIYITNVVYLIQSYFILHIYPTYRLPPSLNNNDKLIHNYMIVAIILINYNKIRNVLIEYILV